MDYIPDVIQLRGNVDEKGEVRPSDPGESPQFFSVYISNPNGTFRWLADYNDPKEADAFALGLFTAWGHKPTIDRGQFDWSLRWRV